MGRWLPATIGAATGCHRHCGCLGQLVGVAARDVKNELADESNKNTPHTSSTSEASNISETSNTSNTSDDELSDMERTLIKLLRNNDIPPDIVAESIREVMERRMGR